MMETYEELRDRLAASKFRSRFHLTVQDRVYLAEKGWHVIEAQARKIITERLAPADPDHDGSQTPMRGHVVFIAQHATATCCRGCLEKWHGIRKGHALTENEISYVVGTIVSWLKDKAGDLSGIPATPDLF